MNLFILLPGIIFSLFATASLAYISMATMVGPWIAPTLVLMGSMILKLRRTTKDPSEINKELALMQTIGSIGGIVAIGVGFTLPTLYFLDPNYFNSWIQNPVRFSLLISAICLSAGGLGILLARILAKKFIIKEKLEFPVSTLIYETITSQSQSKQAKSMLKGFSSSFIICILRDGFLKFKGIMPKALYPLQSILDKEMAIAIWPTVWALGFILGIGIVFPLLVGMLSKYVVLYPLNQLKFLQHLTLKNFTNAFCGGMVVSGLIFDLLRYPRIIYKNIRKNLELDLLEKFKNKLLNLKNKKNNLFKTNRSYKNLLRFVEPTVVLIASFLILNYLKFPIHAQILLLIFITFATYQISHLSARIGLVQFGRFATFIMLPMILLFKLSYLQITMICVFFNVCAAATSDLLFDYKVGNLCKIKLNRIYKYQWLGLLITSLCLGFFMWLLFTNLQLGSAELFAQRAKSRALLILSPSFDLYAIGFGFAYGLVLKKLKISPVMVFGGLLMPNYITIGLLIGALGSLISKNPKLLFPFWSGAFASESLWILLTIVMKMFL